MCIWLFLQRIFQSLHLVQVLLKLLYFHLFSKEFLLIKKKMVKAALSLLSDLFHSKVKVLIFLQVTFSAINVDVSTNQPFANFMIITSLVIWILAYIAYSECAPIHAQELLFFHIPFHRHYFDSWSQSPLPLSFRFSIIHFLLTLKFPSPVHFRPCHFTPLNQHNCQKQNSCTSQKLYNTPLLAKKQSSGKP